MENRGLYSIHEDGESVLNYKGVLVGIAIFPFYVYLFPMACSFLIGKFESATGYTVSGSLANLYYYIFLIGIVALFFGKFLVSSAKSIKGSAPWYWWVAAPILGVMADYTGNLISRIVTTLVIDRGESVNQATVTSFYDEQPVMVFIMAVILAPIVEETFFRAVLFKPLAKKKHLIIPAYIISAIGFGALHVVSNAIELGDPTELVLMIDYIPAAIILAAVYKKLNNIWGSILTHSLINASALLMMTYNKLAF